MPTLRQRKEESRDRHTFCNRSLIKLQFKTEIDPTSLSPFLPPFFIADTHEMGTQLQSEE